MTEIKLKPTSIQLLKERMREARKEWMALKCTYQYWSSQVLEQFPEHQNNRHLYNVWYLRVSDLQILEYTETLIQEIKESLTVSNKA